MSVSPDTAAVHNQVQQAGLTTRTDRLIREDISSMLFDTKTHRIYIETTETSRGTIKIRNRYRFCVLNKAKTTTNKKKTNNNNSGEKTDASLKHLHKEEWRQNTRLWIAIICFLFPKLKKKKLKAHYCTGERIISPWMDYVAVEGKLLSLLLCMCLTGLPAGLHEDAGRPELCFLDRLWVCQSQET